MPQHKPPPDVPSIDKVLEFTATEPDVTTRIAGYSAMRDDVGIHSHTYALHIADQFKSHVINIPVGAMLPFADATHCQAFIDMTHTHIVETCTAMSDFTDPHGMRAHWQCPPINTTGITLHSNWQMLINIIQQSITNVEEYVYWLFAAAIMPADCKSPCTSSRQQHMLL